MLYIKLVRSASPNVEREVDDLASEIIAANVNVCGFDTEMTVVSAMKTALLQEEEFVVPSIVQFCLKIKAAKYTHSFNVPELDKDTHYTCYILPLKVLLDKTRALPKNFIALLRSERLVKASVGMRNDLNMLERSLGIVIGAPLELQTLAIAAGATNLGLSELATLFTPLRKGESTQGDYDGHLTDDQVKYSAYDAMISHVLVERFLSNTIVLKSAIVDFPIDDATYKSMRNYLTGVFAESNIDRMSEKKIINSFSNAYSDWKNRYNRGTVENATKKFLAKAVAARALFKSGDEYSTKATPLSASPHVVRVQTHQAEYVPEPGETTESIASKVSAMLAEESLERADYTVVGLHNSIKSKVKLSGTENTRRKMVDAIISAITSAGNLEFNSATKKYRYIAVD